MCGYCEKTCNSWERNYTALDILNEIRTSPPDNNSLCFLITRYMWNNCWPTMLNWAPYIWLTTIFTYHVRWCFTGVCDFVLGWGGGGGMHPVQIPFWVLSGEMGVGYILSRSCMGRSCPGGGGWGVGTSPSDLPPSPVKTGLVGRGWVSTLTKWPKPPSLG